MTPYYRNFHTLIVTTFLISVFIIISPVESKSKKVVAPAQKINFPPPPAEAVVEWVRTIKSADDVVKSSRFKDIILGKDEITKLMLMAPTDVTIGPDETIYAVDQRLDVVAIINIKDQRFEFFTGSGSARLARPNGVAVDDNGNLYVSDIQARAVYKFNKDLKFIDSFGGPDVFVKPTSIAINKNGGKLAVCDTGASTIKVFDTTNLSEVTNIGTGQHGSKDGYLNRPTSVAFDQEDYIYVSDFLNFRIQVFTPEGDLEFEFGEPGDRAGEMARPRAVMADAENQIIYVVDSAFQVVQMFNFDGEYLMAFGGAGIENGQFTLPTGIDRRGDLIVVADSINRRIQLFRFLGTPNMAQ